ncbi:MAG: LysM peptidoglycan-binding domain-containing protein, partial [Methanoregulaceae archaeon]|nr:LysM peptidoglycan-binding domain-containing protein [Methanoregulaceae archaeon]
MISAQPWMLVAIVLIPFLGTLAIILLHNRPDVREAASLAASVLTFALCIVTLPSAFAAEPVSTQSFEVLPGLSIQLTADALGLLFACIASLLWIITTIFSIGYMRGLREHSQTRYYACFAICIGSVMGVAFSSNLFALFVFSTSYVFSASTHTVKSGDTLQAISKKYQVSVGALKRLNSLNTAKLKIGQVLVVTTDADTPARTKAKGGKTPASGNQRAITTAGDTANSDFIRYKVVKGDTVESLAARFDLEEDEILELNNLKKKSLTPGKLIRL